MKTAIAKWILNLTIFSLLTSLLLRLLPGKSYAPYIRLFSGFILILIFLDPFLENTGISESIAANIQKELFQLEKEEMESDLLKVEETQKQNYEAIYAKEAAAQITLWATKKDYPVLETECKLKDGEIQKITLTCETKLSPNDQKELKNYLQSFYQVQSSNIHIKVVNSDG